VINPEEEHMREGHARSHRTANVAGASDCAHFVESGHFCCRPKASVRTAAHHTPGSDEVHSSGPWRPDARFAMAQRERGGAPAEVCGFGQSRRPALAEIIGARRMWTVAMISSGSMPWR
jgi:hypothetical protein